MIKRAVFLAILLLVFIPLLEKAKTQHPTPIKKPLEAFPQQIDGFRLVKQDRMSPKVERVLGVDSYIMGKYCRQKECVDLYVGFFEEQQEGAMIHSPKHCMPGGGWLPVEDKIIKIKTQRGPIPVNRLILQKGEEKILVYYWYQGRGRIVADEFKDRLYLLSDRILKHRSDGALVRLIIPYRQEAENTLRDFTRALLPVLEDYLPS